MSFNFKNKSGNIKTLNTQMLNKTASMFEYEGLPETIPYFELEKILQTNGYGFITEYQGKLYCFSGSLGGEQDAYLNYKDFIISNAPLNFFKQLNIETEGVLIKNDDYMQGLLPIFDRYNTFIVENDITSVNVSAGLIDGNATVSGRGSHSLSVGNNVINITVTAENGDIKTYVINITRKSAQSGGNTDGFKTDYNVDSSKKIMTKIGVGSQASSVLDNVSYSNGCYGKILKNDGSERGDTVVTGDKLVVYKADGSVYDEYSIVIYGDVNGDGVIDLYDFVAIKRAVL